MKRVIERLLSWALALSLLLSAITLILYAYLGQYMRMLVDDFCTANIGLYYGAWDGFVFIYSRWASNYTNFLIKYGLAGFQPEIHPWIGLATVLGWVLAFYYCLMQFFRLIKAPQPKRLALILALILSFTIYRLFPNYQHAWWLAAVVPYVWSLIGFVFLPGIWFQYWRGEFSWPRSILMFIVSSVLIFILGGFVEVLGLVMIASLGLAFLASPWFKKERRLEWMLLIVVCGFTALASLGIAVLSPGAAVRRAVLLTGSTIEQPTSYDDIYTEARQELILEAEDLEGASPLDSFLPSLWYTSLYLFGEAFGNAFGQTIAFGYLAYLFLFLVLAAIFYLERFPDYQIPAPQQLGRAALVVLVAGFLLNFLIIWAIYYSSSLILTRPLIFNRLIQTGMFFAWVYLFIAAAQRKNWFKRLRRARTWPFLLLVVIFLLIWTPAVSIFKLLELQPQLETFAKGWDERDAYLSSQENAELIYLDKLEYDAAELFALGELAPDDGESPTWYNECLANYYHIGRIYLNEDESP